MSSIPAIVRIAAALSPQDAVLQRPKVNVKQSADGTVTVTVPDAPGTTPSSKLEPSYSYRLPQRVVQTQAAPVGTQVDTRA